MVKKTVTMNSAKKGDNFGTKDGMERMKKFLSRDNSIFLIKNWYRDGYSFREIADKIGVTLEVFKKARNEFEELDQALIESKEVIDYKVENALLKSALGYMTKEVKVTTTMRYGKVVETIKEVTDREVAPSVPAIQTWLYNRQKEKWKNMNAKTNMFEDMVEDSTIEVTVRRAEKDESGCVEEKDIVLRKRTEEERAKLEKEKKRKKAEEEKEALRTTEVDEGYEPTDLDEWPEDWEDSDEDYEES